MRTLILTKSHQFYPFTDFMRTAGIPLTTYLTKHRLPTRMLEMPDLYIDEGRFWRLSDELVRREGLPDFGYQVGRRMTLQDLGEFGTLLLQQASLLQALRTFCVAIRAECYGVIFELERRGEYIWLSMRSQNGNDAFSAIVELYDLQVMWRIVESAAGGPWLPSAVELQASSLPAEFRAGAISTGPIHFSSPRTAFAIPVEMLSRPMSEYHASTNAGRTDPEELSVTDDIDFPTQLRWLLRGYLGNNMDLHNLADLLYLSERSLQRRLTEAGTSFRQVQEETRFDLAKYLLHKTDTSVTEIGFELGYTKPANFSRAFQRWAGVSPRQYRTHRLQ
jgi:AraC-like DNA-binding protein